MKGPQDTLILGWGNPGRGDDGLGPEFVQAVESLSLPGVDADSDFQLQVEDAWEVTHYRRVLFVDADRSAAEPFRLQRLEAAGRGLVFSTHSLSPATVMALARDLFDCHREAWVLGIRGYEFDIFEERLSAGARENLDAAVRAVEPLLRCPGGWRAMDPISPTE